MIKTSVTNREIWRIAYPIMLGNLAQTVITFTDTAFLGHLGLEAYFSDEENLEMFSSDMEEEQEVDDLEMDLSDENYDKYLSTKLEEMSLEELQNLLDGAVECEDFEMASKIHDEIERRKQE